MARGPSKKVREAYALGQKNKEVHLRGGDPELMYQSLQHLSERLPDHTIIYPGHNYGITPTTTMAEQLAGNPFLHFANASGFVEYRTHLHDREEPYRPEQAAFTHASSGLGSRN